MNDMASVIVPKSDQINADDLIAGPRTIRISGVAIRGGEEQPVSIAIEGDKKVFRPCKSMSRVMVQAWGPDSSQYVGRSLTLFRDPAVKWGGLEVGGIRIGAMSHIEGPLTMALTATKGSRKPFTVRPLVAEVVKHTAADFDAADDLAVAKGWIGRLVLAVNGAKDREALAKVQNPARMASLNDYRERFPELTGDVDAAIAARLAEFEAADGE